MRVSRAAAAGWVIVALGIGILIAILPFAVGLLGAGVLWVVCAPAQRRLSQRLGRRWSAALVLLGAILLLLVPGALLVIVAMQEAPGILQALPSSQTFQSLARLRIGVFDVGGWIATAGDTLVSWLSERALQVFGSVARTILNLVIAFFGLYYLLVAPEGTWERVRSYLPFSSANADLLRERFHSVTEATLLGIALTAVLQGSLVGVFFWIVGLPNGLFWGMVTGVASVLPVVGSAVVWLPAAGVLALEGRYGAAVALVLFGFVVVSNIDNVVRLVVFKRVSNIHPMITLVGAFAGVRYAGLAGVLLGPLAISFFFELLRVYRGEHGQGTAGQLLPGRDLPPDAPPVPGNE